MPTASSLLEYISSGSFDTRLSGITQDNSRLELERCRYVEAVKKFIELYGDREANIFSAPGRSEISGNHTDHQHGHVLAASINRDAIAVASKRDDDIVRVVSGSSSFITISLSSLNKDESEFGTTTALIRGVLRGICDRGYKVGGFDCYITSEVLIGAGLSSSAAFETVIGTVVNGFYNDMAISAVTIAQIGQFAENVFFGKPCGLMDQMACSVGSLVHIDFADPDEPVVEAVDFDLDKYGMSLVITDTKGSHSDLTADYAAVPAEMSSVAAFFGKEFLNDVPEDDVISHIGDIRRNCGDRAVLRALHFYNENRRVKAIVDAIKNDDIDGFLNGIRSSGDSSFKYLQNVYTNSDVKHQNVSIALLMSDVILNAGKGVARVHGGGFAGTIQAFVKNDAVEEYKDSMEQIFGEGTSSVLKIRKFGGIKLI